MVSIKFYFIIFAFELPKEIERLVPKKIFQTSKQIDTKRLRRIKLMFQKKSQKRKKRVHLFTTKKGKRFLYNLREKQ